MSKKWWLGLLILPLVVLGCEKRKSAMTMMEEVSGKAAQSTEGSGQTETVTVAQNSSSSEGQQSSASGPTEGVSGEGGEGGGRIEGGGEGSCVPDPKLRIEF